MNPQPASNKGWVVTFAALGTNLVLGSLYAWSVMGKALVTEWKWTKTEAAWPYTTSAIAFSIMMIFAGRMQDKIGPKLIAILGGITLGLGLILSSFSHSLTTMILTFGVVGGLGIGLGYSATTPPAIKWFPPSKKGMISGIVVCGIGLSPAYMAPLTQWLLGKWDVATNIPNTFIALGIGTIIIVSILATLLTNPPADYKPTAAAPAGGGPAKPAPAARRDVDWAEMLRTPQFWMLWLIMVLTASAGLMIIGHLATIAKVQMKVDWGYGAVVMLAIFNTSGRLVGGFFSDKIGRTNTMLLFFLLQALNMFAFSHYTTANMLLFGAACTGLCYGTIFPLFPSTTADYYGLKNLGVNYGFVFTAFGAAAYLGPIFIGGRYADAATKAGNAAHAYDQAYIVCAIMLIAGAVLSLMLKAPKLDSAAPAASGAPLREKVGR